MSAPPERRLAQFVVGLPQAGLPVRGAAQAAGAAAALEGLAALHDLRDLASARVASAAGGRSTSTRRAY